MAISQANQILEFIHSLQFNGTLPEGIGLLHPLRNDREMKQVTTLFYQKYYADNRPRMLILGINPGRLGAGATGIPFTDTVRMRDVCGIHINHFSTHEPSSVFVYEMIDAFGGAEAFYKCFYISSVCPLGFVKKSNSGKEVNYNYYDSPALMKAITPFAVKCMEAQLRFGLNRKVVFCLGTGKNLKFIQELNDQYGWFEKVIALEHPRYIMQYKRKKLEHYVNKYLEAFSPYTDPSRVK